MTPAFAFQSLVFYRRKQKGIPPGVGDWLHKDFAGFQSEDSQKDDPRSRGLSDTEASDGLRAGAACIAPGIRTVENKKSLCSLDLLVLLGQAKSTIIKYYILINAEIEVDETTGEPRYVHYINSPQGLAAILTRNEAGEDALNYVLTDHLGSVQILTDEQGTLLEEYSYDAWGLRRDPGSLEAYVPDPEADTDYGFTGHEHLDAFKLINMNGRMYDPVLGRFLSPDPVLQFPDYTQGLNPYSYALNNPLKYTDPSGYSLVGNLVAIGVSIILATTPMLAVLAYSVVMTIDYAIEQGRSVNIGELGSYFAQTFAMSMASMGTSKIIGDIFKHTAGSIWNELGRAAAHGLTNGTIRVIQGGKFEHGFLSGFVSSLGGSFMQTHGANMDFGTKVVLCAAIGGTAEALGGGKFANGAVTGA